MLILGEIADKMPTIPELWIQHLIMALILSAIAFWHRWLAIAAIPLCAWWIWTTYVMAYRDMSVADLIQIEMGQVWINHLIASSALPLILVSGIATYKYSLHSRKNKSLRLSAFA